MPSRWGLPVATVSSSSWTLTAPLPARVQRALAYLDVPPPETPALEAAMPPPVAPIAPRAPTFVKQLALGLAIFAGVLAAAIPFAFFSEGMALAAAVGVGSVLVAIFARRLRIALVIATLLAVLGAFAATHSIHVALQPSNFPIRLSALAPASGETLRNARPVQLATAVLLPTRTEIGGTQIPLAGWALPAALFVFWMLGFAAIVANRKLARWMWRHVAKKLPA
jgi:hypothetical protein